MIQEIASTSGGAVVKILSDKSERYDKYKYKKRHEEDTAVAILGSQAVIIEAFKRIIEQIEYFKNGGPVLSTGKAIFMSIPDQFKNCIILRKGVIGTSELNNIVHSTSTGTTVKKYDYQKERSPSYKRRVSRSKSKSFPRHQKEFIREIDYNRENRDNRENREREDDYYKNKNRYLVKEDMYKDQKRYSRQYRSNSREIRDERNLYRDRSRSRERVERVERDYYKDKYEKYPKETRIDYPLSKSAIPQKIYQSSRDNNYTNYQSQQPQLPSNNINPSQDHNKYYPPQENRFQNQSQIPSISFDENGTTKLSVSILVPDQMVSMIIGSNGVNVKGLMNKTGSLISFAKEVSYNNNKLNSIKMIVKS